MDGEGAYKKRDDVGWRIGGGGHSPIGGILAAEGRSAVGIPSPSRPGLAANHAEPLY